ncbi:hypothetical protein C8R43DRAFT_1131978 [Mycena crocata]|nr:hypothetical protein C8R43DRAFT_1131978 [Mycena crocata]
MAKIDELGPVNYIVSPDAVHHLFLGEFKKAYPSAKLIAPAATVERADKTLTFDGVWVGIHQKRSMGSKTMRIESCYFSGFKTTSSGAIPLIGNFTPSSWLHGKFASAMGEDKATMKRDVKTVADWNFTHIIPCHGDVIETGGKEAWLNAYKAYLDSVV